MAAGAPRPATRPQAPRGLARDRKGTTVVLLWDDKVSEQAGSQMTRPGRRHAGDGGGRVGDGWGAGGP